MVEFNDTIDGFQFNNEETAKKARQESKAIVYISNQIDFSQPRMVFQAYNQLLTQNLFSTIVGYSFLKKLQTILIESPEIDGGTIMPIPVASFNISIDEREKIIAENQASMTNASKVKSNISKSSKVDTSRIKKLTRANTILLSGCIAMAIIIVLMFIINSTINSPTILNYQEKITNEYAAWEQELTNRENELNKREVVIKQKEDAEKYAPKADVSDPDIQDDAVE